MAASTLSHAVEPVELDAPIIVNGNRYWNVKEIDTSTYLSDQYATFDTNKNPNTVDYQLDNETIKVFLLDGKDKLGIINQTSTGDSEIYELYTGFGVCDQKNGTYNAPVVNSLKVTGTLVVKGEAQLHIRGQYKKSSYDAFSGVVGDRVIIDEKASFTADRLDVSDLIVKGGTVSLHGYNNNGNSSIPWQEKDTKMVQIKNSLHQENGIITIGKADKAPHTATKTNIIGTTTTYYYSNYFKGNISQTSGTTNVYGHNYLEGNISISQNGNGNINFRDRVHLKQNGAIFSITQGNNMPESGTDSSSLVLGAIYGSGATVNINQEGSGDIKIAHGTSFTSTATVNIEQSGDGNIYIGGGHGISHTDLSGFLNNSQTTYNFTQTGAGAIHISADATITADTVSIGSGSTLDVKGTVTVTGTSTLKGDVIVAEGATFNLNGSTTISGESSLQGSNVNINGCVTFEDTADLTVSTTISMSTGNSMTFCIGSTAEERAAMTMTETGNLEFEAGSLKLELTDVVLQQMIDEATKEGTEYTLTLIDNISDTDVTQLQAAIDSGNLTLEDYRWSTINTFAMHSSTPNVTIESNGLVLENNALKAIMKATSQSIPEPATTTLSLIALAGLSMRRRRR